MKPASCRLWILILVPIVLGRTLAALAVDPPQGTYLETCTAAKIDGEALAATCKKADGTEQPAALANYKQCTGDIWNNDGVLGCSQGAAPAGPYTQSCEYAAILGDVLSATCTLGSGEKVVASLPDYKRCLSGTIDNLGGRLVCDSDGTPRGPYSKSCVDKNVGNGKLIALCKSRSGTYVSASLRDYKSCIPDSIVNANGSLVCDWTEYPAGNYTKSCFFKKTSGTMLIASCQTRTGELQPTSLNDYEDCRSGIHNVDGDLTCGGR
jgi:hypothetical protein